MWKYIPWLGPVVALLGVFDLYPLVEVIRLSLTNWSGLGGSRFVGLSNYRSAVEDPIFREALLHSAIYAGGTIVAKVVLGLGLALAAAGVTRMVGAYRTFLLLPAQMSFVAVGVLWSFVYAPSFGLANAAIHQVTGLNTFRLTWLGNPHIALYAVMAADVWKWVGIHMIIFYAGLQSIPAQLYEAAKVDGSSGYSTLRRITLPLMRPVILLNVLLAGAGAFNVFDIVYVMTDGGPYNATETVMTYVYRVAFREFEFGYASAMSVILFCVVLVGTLLVLGLIRRSVRE